MLLEDKIRELCEQAVQAKDEEDALRSLEELRAALHKHIDELRDRLTASSTFSARRHVTPKKAA